MLLLLFLNLLDTGIAHLVTFLTARFHMCAHYIFSGHQLSG